MQIEEIRRRVLDWYDANRRDLPWRGETDPYRILVSEIMLQQTGVDRVRGYYERFLQEFPDFPTLAKAARVEVLRAWGGLGYNRRAVYLHECAKIVTQQHGGALPSDPIQLKRLPSIGPYTLAALRSFAFHHDVAAIDTNIRRVIGRIGFGGAATSDQISQLADQLLPSGRGSDWNQALMDFGAIQCTASNPRCPICPLADLCATARSGPPRSLRGVAEPKAPYLGSRRYYRGRVVARLRTLPPRSFISLTDLAKEIRPDSDDPTWLIGIAQSLAEHGLAFLEDSGNGYRIGPPE